MNKEIPYKIYLEENELPTQWYNVRADMKNKPAPLLNPGTGQPVVAEDLLPVFCEELVKQELDNETPYFDIPEDAWKKAIQECVPEKFRELNLRAFDLGREETLCQM